MKQSLDEGLCRDFPELCIDRHGDMRETCMCWGFDTGSGWEPIIRQALTELEELRKQPGHEGLKLTQVKEKFGGLRIYLSHYSEEAVAIIGKASQASYKTCENCGTTEGVTTEGDRWIRSLCAACRDKG